MKKLIPLGLLSLLVAGCADRTWEEEAVPLQLLAFSYPATVVLDFSELYQLQVVLSGQLPQDEVHCTLSGQLEDYLFQLSDAGNQLYPDSSALVPGATGDNVPGDGIYTRRADLGALAEGDYALQVEVRREGIVNLEDGAVFTVATDQPPLVEVLEYPDSLHSGFASAIMLFGISDPDPGDEIIVRELIDIELPLAPLSLTQLDDTLAFLELDSTFGADRMGWRELVVRAVDTPGLMGTDTFQVWVGNNPPQLGSLTYFELPGCDTTLATEELELAGDTLTIFLPSEGARCFHITLPVMEEQGWQDFDYAVCWIKDADPPVYLGSLDFTDNGASPDTLSGDGVYTAGFSFANWNQPDEYLFEIHAADVVGQHSDTLTTTVIVLAPEVPGGSPILAPARGCYPNPFRGGKL